VADASAEMLVFFFFECFSFWSLGGYFCEITCLCLVSFRMVSLTVRLVASFDHAHSSYMDGNVLVIRVNFLDLVSC